MKEHYVKVTTPVILEEDMVAMQLWESYCCLLWRTRVLIIMCLVMTIICSTGWRETTLVVWNMLPLVLGERQGRNIINQSWVWHILTSIRYDQYPDNTLENEELGMELRHFFFGYGFAYFVVRKEIMRMAFVDLYGDVVYESVRYK